MSTADEMLEMTIGDRLRSDRSWFNAIRDRGAELVQQMTAPLDGDVPKTAAEVGAAFQPAEPTRAEIKAAKLAKAKAVLHRGKQVCERDLTVTCPRHDHGDVVVTIEYGFDGWSLKIVPTGCDVEPHTWTPEERATLADRIDVAFGNWTTNQEERGAE